MRILPCHATQQVDVTRGTTSRVTAVVIFFRPHSHYPTGLTGEIFLGFIQFPIQPTSLGSPRRALPEALSADALLPTSSTDSLIPWYLLLRPL
jgi:hypothetical protein